jgi:hypothetical protein
MRFFSLIKKTLMLATAATSSFASAAIECYEFPPQKRNTPPPCYVPYEMMIGEGFFHYREGGSRCWGLLGEEEGRARIVDETTDEIVFELESDTLKSFTFYPDEEKGVIDFVIGYQVKMSCFER